MSEVRLTSSAALGAADQSVLPGERRADGRHARF
jgi:hypothetical protein